MMILQAEVEVAKVLRAWVLLWAKVVLRESSVPGLQSQRDSRSGVGEEWGVRGGGWKGGRRALFFHSVDFETFILHFCTLEASSAPQ